MPWNRDNCTRRAHTIHATRPARGTHKLRHGKQSSHHSLRVLIQNWGGCAGGPSQWPAWKHDVRARESGAAETALLKTSALAGEQAGGQEAGRAGACAKRRAGTDAAVGEVCAVRASVALPRGGPRGGEKKAAEECTGSHSMVLIQDGCSAACRQRRAGSYKCSSTMKLRRGLRGAERAAPQQGNGGAARQAGRPTQIKRVLNSR